MGMWGKQELNERLNEKKEMLEKEKQEQLQRAADKQEMLEQASLSFFCEYSESPSILFFHNINISVRIC